MTAPSLDLREIVVLPDAAAAQTVADVAVDAFASQCVVAVAVLLLLLLLVVAAAVAVAVAAVIAAATIVVVVAAVVVAPLPASERAFFE